MSDLALTDPRNAARLGHPATALTMVARCVRLSRRTVDALIMSLVLPVMLMLVFVYLFGGAIEYRRRVCHVRGARRDPALRRVRLRADRGQRSPGHEGRHHRQIPLYGHRRCLGPGWPCGGQCGPQHRLDRMVVRGGAR